MIVVRQYYLLNSSYRLSYHIPSFSFIYLSKIENQNTKGPQNYIDNLKSKFLQTLKFK